MKVRVRLLWEDQCIGVWKHPSERRLVWQRRISDHPEAEIGTQMVRESVGLKNHIVIRFKCRYIVRH